jgi:hypothetical protein
MLKERPTTLQQGRSGDISLTYRSVTCKSSIDNPVSCADLVCSYERFLQVLVIYGDGTIAFTTGDTLKLLEDAQIIKPHFMAGVPRVYNRYDFGLSSHD